MWQDARCPCLVYSSLRGTYAEGWSGQISSPPVVTASCRATLGTAWAVVRPPSAAPASRGRRPLPTVGSFDASRGACAARPDCAISWQTAGLGRSWGLAQRTPTPCQFRCRCCDAARRQCCRPRRFPVPSALLVMLRECRPQIALSAAISTRIAPARAAKPGHAASPAARG